MEPMQWLTLIVFGLTILAVITNVIDSTLAALIGVGCFSLLWILVILFGNPLFLGGVVGQLRDRIAEPGRASWRKSALVLPGAEPG